VLFSAAVKGQAYFENYYTPQFLPQGSSLAKTFIKWLIIAWLKTASGRGHLA
jgi:hypothetical protein